MTMPDTDEFRAAAIIRQIAHARAAGSGRGFDLGDDTAIGATGLGLDSVAIVELLLECEEVLQVPFPAALFDQGPLTIRRLIDHAALYSPSATP